MFLILYLVGLAAGIIVPLICYAARPHQKQGRYHFNSKYEKYVPLADRDITKNTRKDRSISREDGE